MNRSNIRSLTSAGLGDERIGDALGDPAGLGRIFGGLGE
jgi:hypothetical protein